MRGGLDFTVFRRTDLNFFRQIKSYSFVANFPQGVFSFTLSGNLDRTLLLQKNWFFSGSFGFIRESLDFTLFAKKHLLLFLQKKILCFSDLLREGLELTLSRKFDYIPFLQKKEMLVFFRKLSQANVWSCAFWYFWIALLFYKTRIWFFFGSFSFLQENGAFTIFGLVYFICIE